MNRKLLLALVLLALLLALLGPTALAASPSPPHAPGYVVVPATLTGGAYQLGGQAWRIEGWASSERYQLSAGHQPASDLGCCCKAYTPCMRR